MLEHHPVLKERLLACAVFGAIAVGVVAASDLMITGGFDFPSSERGAHADTPNYFQVAAETWSDAWTPEAHARTVMWIDETPREADYTSYQPEPLVGGVDDPDTQFSQYRGPNEEELRREIAEMYAALPSAADTNSHGDDTYADDAYVDEAEFGDETYAEAAPASEKGEFSTYGSASPW